MRKSIGPCTVTCGTPLRTLDLIVENEKEYWSLHSPCGTPLRTLDLIEGTLLTTSHCLWDVKNDNIQLIVKLEK